jgi:hypothetical protein
MRRADGDAPTVGVGRLQAAVNPGERYDYDGKSAAYPDIRLVWWAGGNRFITIRT